MTVMVFLLSLLHLDMQRCGCVIAQPSVDRSQQNERIHLTNPYAYHTSVATIHRNFKRRNNSKNTQKIQ